MLSPSPVILSRAKNPGIPFGENSAKHPYICNIKQIRRSFVAFGSSVMTVNQVFQQALKSGPHIGLDTRPAPIPCAGDQKGRETFSLSIHMKSHVNGLVNGQN